MSPDGKVRVVVKSRRVPSRTFDFSEPVYSPIGMRMGTKSNRLVVYDYVLDEEHRRAIEEGHKLACDLGLDLEVVDRTRSGLFRRVLSSFGRGRSGEPSIEVRPPLGAQPEAPRVLVQHG